MSERNTNDIGRRNFMKAASAVAGAGLLGVGTAAAGESTQFDPAFANWRVREARKVWERGYRGCENRTIGLTDSGLDARHPDLGPWNGVRATVDDGGLVLTGPDLEQPTRVKLDDKTVTRTGSAGPGTFATGSEVETVPFTPPETAAELDATLTWSPSAQNTNDLELRLEVENDGNWEEVTTAATANEKEVIEGIQVDSSKEYRFVVEEYATVSCTFEIVGEFYEYDGELETYPTGDGESPVFDFSDFDVTPKTVGWYNETPRYGDYEEPLDPDGHGSHCSSIMGGSGRASAVDPEALVQEEPRTILTAGDTHSYEFEVAAGAGVFISAYGEGIELVIEGPDGRELDSSEVGIGDTSTYDNNVAEAPAERDGSYTLYVRPAGGELASTGRLQKVAAGAFLPEGETAGDRDAAAGSVALHSGLAPNAALVCLQGLSDPTVDLGTHAEDFSRIFNMRAVNMSWGYVGGAPLGAFGGAFGGDIVGAVKQIAEGGILTVAAAGNAATPANGNGAPGIADEAISVVATGPRDGIVSYSSGGLGGDDEDGEGTYMKPDVTAPGGSLTDLANAAESGDPDALEADQPAIRDYTGKAGTSMASPYTTGIAGLVAEAMEFDAPEAIALPEPAETQLDDVLRLKQAILATASETVFTAAPYHRAHAPTYQHGGRDPYEGYGRVNPDAAVDAVARTLVDGSSVAPGEETSVTETATVGLNVPDDSRAVAGHVVAPNGTIDIGAEFSHYGGGNKSMAKENPHLDLFVYDAANPATNGEPNVVASAQAVQGSGSLSADVEEGVYYVVAKLVNVPGAVNGYDVQAHFDLAVSYTAAELPAFTASGTRADDGSAFTARQTNWVQITVNDISSDLPDETVVTVTDHSPWNVDTKYGDAEEYDNGTVTFGTTTAGDIRDGGVEYEYPADAPDETSRDTFGPARVTLVDSSDEFSNEFAEFGGTDTNTVVGASTNTDETADSATDETSLTDDAGETVTSTTDSLL